MNGKKKTSLVKARLPKGMRDVEAQELRALRQMLSTIAGVYERYGFEPLDTPAFEYTDALGKFLPDTDRPNEGVFSFQDEDEQWVSLRYDLTAPLARYVAANFDALPKPFRRYQSGYVYRNEKPGPGRFRQFMQFDADTVGTANPAADAELCMLAADTLEALGVPRRNYVIKISSRKILDSLMAVIGLGGSINAGRRLVVFRAIDKLDRLGPIGVTELLGPGRKDDSGDFTPGAGLSHEQIDTLLGAIQTTKRMGAIRASLETIGADRRNYMLPTGIPVVVDNAKTLEIWKVGIETAASLFGVQPDQSAINELRTISEHFESAGFNADQIRLDASVVRGLEYYTGPVFEAELLFPAGSEDSEAVRFGSVGGGGRYDGLVSRFRSQPVPATGFSIGVSRLYAALTHLGKLRENAAAQGPVVVLVMDKDRVGDYLRITRELREAGIRAEMYVGDAGMKAQMKYADKRGSPCVIIQGEDERARGEVTIKDLLEGARLSGEIAGRDEWREARPAQFSVPASDMVKEVRLLLERQARG